jgi:endogenous inhibitor of DNA gyrase (YacG/DUF329 family)
LVDLGRWLKEDYRLPSDEVYGETSPDEGDTSNPP